MPLDVPCGARRERQQPLGWSRQQPQLADAGGGVPRPSDCLTVHLVDTWRAQLLDPHHAPVEPRTPVDAVRSPVDSGPLRVEPDRVVRSIVEHAGEHTDVLLAAVSLTFRHFYSFGSERSAARSERRALASSCSATALRLLLVPESRVLVPRADRRPGRLKPRVRGRDLLGPILDQAESLGLRVGILGGSPQSQPVVTSAVRQRWPALRVNGCWTPTPRDLDHPDRAAELAGQVRRARVDLLLVSLPTPRQERWIAEHGSASGARVCLAFGDLASILADQGRHRSAQDAVGQVLRKWVRRVTW